MVNNADGVDWNAFAWALARYVQHCNGPHRDKRICPVEARHQIATVMPFPVKRFGKRPLGV